MAQYRLATLDVSARLQLTLEMLTPRAARGWGRVTALAAEYKVSRTLLYELCDRGQQALLAALAPQAAGPRPPVPTLTVDSAFIQRAIAILATQRGTVRGIQQGLELLLQTPRSVGYISQTLTRLGAQAAVQNAVLRVPLPVLAEADEIFQGRQPCLTVVDGRSFLVLNLALAAARDGTTWGVAFLDLQARDHRPSSDSRPWRRHTTEWHGRAYRVHCSRSRCVRRAVGCQRPGGMVLSHFASCMVLRPFPTHGWLAAQYAHAV